MLDPRQNDSAFAVRTIDGQALEFEICRKFPVAGRAEKLEDLFGLIDFPNPCGSRRGRSRFWRFGLWLRLGRRRGRLVNRLRDRWPWRGVWWPGNWLLARCLHAGRRLNDGRHGRGHRRRYDGDLGRCFLDG